MFEGIIKNPDFGIRNISSILVNMFTMECHTLWATAVCSPLIFKNLLQCTGLVTFYPLALVCGVGGVVFTYTPVQELPRFATGAAEPISE